MFQRRMLNKKKKFQNQFKTSLIFFIDSIKDITVKSCKWIVISYRVRNIYILSFQEPGNELWKRSFPRPGEKLI